MMLETDVFIYPLDLGRLQIISVIYHPSERLE